MSDASNDASSQAIEVAQAVEPPPIIQPESRPPEPPSPPPEPQTARPQERTPATPTDFSIEDLVNGKFPGVATRLGTPRTMPASDDPASAAQSFIRQLTTGRDYVPVATDLDTQGGYVFQLAGGTYITYRPPGASSERTEATTANVDINSPKINAMNGGKRLKLKFPKK